MTSTLFRGAAIALLLLSASSAVAADVNPANVTGGTFKVEPIHTRVQFGVDHMGFSTWYGDFTGVSGSLILDAKNVAASKVDITIPVASVSTTNATLNGELAGAEWFDAAKYPTIHFVSSKVTQTAPDKATIAGDLTFHGVTKPVVLTATFHGGGANPMSKTYTVGFDATATLMRSDFGVKTYLPMIGDETTLRISAAFEKTN
jgi:polyisoprenoid-binding protein YceI